MHGENGVGSIDQGYVSTDGGKTFQQMVSVENGGSEGSGGLTDEELRATAVPVSGPLTDTQIRATAVPVSGPLTDTQIRATAVPVSGPLTDTQIRATALPVSGPLTDTQIRATALPVSGPLTDTQIRATPIETTDAGPSQAVVSTHVNNATLLTTPLAITPVAASDHQVIGVDIDIDNISDTAVVVTLRKGSAGTIIKKLNVAAKGSRTITYRGYLVTGVAVVAIYAESSANVELDILTNTFTKVL